MDRGFRKFVSKIPAIPQGFDLVFFGTTSKFILKIPKKCSQIVSLRDRNLTTLRLQLKKYITTFIVNYLTHIKLIHHVTTLRTDPLSNMYHNHNQLITARKVVWRIIILFLNT